MNPRRDPRGRSSAVTSVVVVSLVTFAALAGCSSRPLEILGPSRPSAEYVAASGPSVVQTPPPLIDRWKSPRIRVWTDGWRRFQKEGGVFLDPSRIYDLEIPEQQPVTFHWAALPMSGQGEILGYRWAVDMVDITDETPRGGPDDFAHWSQWSIAETSATVGPVDPGGDHFFFLEARDNLGFVSLVTVRLQVGPASAGGAEGIAIERH